MEKEREPRPSTWAEVRRYRSQSQALDVYEGVRDHILEAELEASVFRLLFVRESYIAILGEEPLSATATAEMEALLLEGRRAQLPPDVMLELRTRREQFRNRGGGFLERRFRG